MARISIDLDQGTFKQLVESADAERRPVRWQAEVVLRRGLRLVATTETAGDDQSGNGNRQDLGTLSRQEGLPVPA
jgi:hypothetical protein